MVCMPQIFLYKLPFLIKFLQSFLFIAVQQLNLNAMHLDLKQLKDNGKFSIFESLISIRLVKVSVLDTNPHGFVQ